MKIAILYSGQLRTFAETYEQQIAYFKSLGNNVHIDLYFSLTDKVGYVDNLNDNRHSLSKRISPVTVDVTEEICRVISKHDFANVTVKKINIETQDSCLYQTFKHRDVLIKGLTLENKLTNLVLQYYKIHQCYKLMAQPLEYNMVVRLRCDVIPRNAIPGSKLEMCLRENRLMVNQYVWEIHQSPSMVNEMLFMGTPDVMRRACNIYNNFARINKLIRKGHVQPFGESIFYGNTLIEGLCAPSDYKFDFNYVVLR